MIKKEFKKNMNTVYAFFQLPPILVDLLEKSQVFNTVRDTFPP